MKLLVTARPRKDRITTTYAIERILLLTALPEYGAIHHMAKAALLLDFRSAQGDLLIQMSLWQLPRPTKDRPHGLKYRLYLGRAGQTLVRYDNETGKGDHRHVGAVETEVPYEFSSLEKLLDDFRVECERHGWRWSE